jgi:hypothetical protein
MCGTHRRPEETQSQGQFVQYEQGLQKTSLSKVDQKHAFIPSARDVVHTSHVGVFCKHPDAQIHWPPTAHGTDALACVRVLNLTRVVDGVSPAPSHDMIGGINHDLTSFCFGLRGDSPQRPEITNFVTAI